MIYFLNKFWIYDDLFFGAEGVSKMVLIKLAGINPVKLENNLERFHRGNRKMQTWVFKHDSKIFENNFNPHDCLYVECSSSIYTLQRGSIICMLILCCEKTMAHTLLRCQCAAEIWHEVKELWARNVKSFNSIKQCLF